MKVQLLLILVLVMFFAKTLISQQNHLDVEGHVKIRGNIDINHMDDTTSVYIGRNAGVNTEQIEPIYLNTFMGANAGRDNTSGSFNSFFGKSAGIFTTTGHSNSFFDLRRGPLTQQEITIPFLERT